MIWNKDGSTWLQVERDGIQRISYVGIMSLCVVELFCKEKSIPLLIRRPRFVPLKAKQNEDQRAAPRAAEQAASAAGAPGESSRGTASRVRRELVKPRDEAGRRIPVSDWLKRYQAPKWAETAPTMPPSPASKTGL